MISDVFDSRFSNVLREEYSEEDLKKAKEQSEINKASIKKKGIIIAIILSVLGICMVVLGIFSITRISYYSDLADKARDAWLYRGESMSEISSNDQKSGLFTILTFFSFFLAFAFSVFGNLWRAAIIRHKITMEELKINKMFYTKEELKERESFVNPAKAKFCEYCGSKLEPDASHCSSCGAVISKD